MLVITFVAHALAVLIGLGSFAFYMAAFFYPEVNRPRDIVWSALGLLYALLLWFGAGQMTAAILLGQAIAVGLLGVLGAQTLSIRREKTPVYQQTPVVITPEVASNWAKNKINQLRIAPAEPVPLKLEKRSLDEFSSERLGIPIDPRRRPVSEYEFVEDGLWNEADENDATDSEQLSLLLSANLSANEDANSEEDADSEEDAVEVTPPSAIADIISVEMPPELNTATEVTTEDPEAAEKTATPAATVETAAPSAETAISEKDVSEEAISENSLEDETAEEEPAIDLRPVATDFKEVDSLEEAQAERQISKAEKTTANAEASTTGTEENSIFSKQANENQAGEASGWDDSDWDDSDWVADGSAEQTFSTKEPQPVSPKTNSPNPIPTLSTNRSASSKEKPSLLAIPVILAGWVKDVVTSMTKPKPSKPVIEIPKREPSIPRTSASPQNLRPASQPISQPTSQPISVKASRGNAFTDTDSTDTDSTNTDSTNTALNSPMPTDTTNATSADTAVASENAPERTRPTEFVEESNWDD